jgi:membrane associated rhomboid family serine protease
MNAPSEKPAPGVTSPRAFIIIGVVLIALGIGLTYVNGVPSVARNGAIGGGIGSLALAGWHFFRSRKA